MTNFNKSKIMKRAWEILRARDIDNKVSLEIPLVFPLYPGETKLCKKEIASFSVALQYAWDEAKREAELARYARIAENEELATQLADIKRRIFVLEMKDRWDEKDRELSRKLEAERRRIIAAA